jgi:hypothetical protein
MHFKTQYLGKLKIILTVPTTMYGCEMTLCWNNIKERLVLRRINFWGFGTHEWPLNPALQCTVPKTCAFNVYCMLFFPHRYARGVLSAVSCTYFIQLISVFPLTVSHADSFTRNWLLTFITGDTSDNTHGQQSCLIWILCWFNISDISSTKW